MIKEMEREYAAQRMYESAVTAGEMFEDCTVRLVVGDKPMFTISLQIDGREVARFSGDHPVDVADGLSSFLVHLQTRSINE